MGTREVDLRRAVRLSALSIVWSGFAGALAVYTAAATGSLSLLGFGADAVIDSIASTVLIWRFRVESHQPERTDRVERIAERTVGLALVALALYLTVGSLVALATHAHPETSFASLALVLASAAVLPPLAVAKYRVARSLGSGALRADSILTAIAGLIAAISLASLAALQLVGVWWADGAAALIVAAVVIREGWHSLRSTENRLSRSLTR
jgi:divalent metal cation (Fe/Co/Zn/Cd) transporter